MRIYEPPNKTVELTLRCRECGTDKKTKMSLPLDATVGDVQMYLCTACTDALRVEQRRAQRAAEAATAPEVQEPFAEELLAEDYLRR